MGKRRIYGLLVGHLKLGELRASIFRGSGNLHRDVADDRDERQRHVGGGDFDCKFGKLKNGFFVQNSFW